MSARPSLAVWKFSSCDGCQLSLLDCEDELVDLVGRVRISYFLEMTRATVEGPYDISLVEGSISTPEDLRRIEEVRRASGVLVTIGACASAGGIQALRNFAKIESFVNAVYAHPEYIATLDRSSPASEHVSVDYELRGCPVNKAQLLEVIAALVEGRRPDIPSYSVCQECKARGITCLMVSKGVACLGPVTQAGCGALCPGVQRGCYGCFGPQEGANTASLARRFSSRGIHSSVISDMFRTFNAGAKAFREQSERSEREADDARTSL